MNQRLAQTLIEKHGIKKLAAIAEYRKIENVSISEAKDAINWAENNMPKLDYNPNKSVTMQPFGVYYSR